MYAQAPQEPAIGTALHAVVNLSHNLAVLYQQNANRPTHCPQGFDRRAQLWLDSVLKFNGTKPERYFEWITKIEQAADTIADPDNWSCYHIALMKAEGSVYTQLQNTHPQTPWAIIKRKLQTEFSTLQTMAHAVDTLQSRRQGTAETLDEYTQDYYRLVQTVHAKSPQNCDDPTLIFNYIRGLRNPELVKKVSRIQTSFGNLLDAGTYCLTQEMEYKMMDRTLSTAGTPPTPIFAIQQPQVPDNRTGMYRRMTRDPGRIMPKTDRHDPDDFVAYGQGTLLKWAQEWATIQCFTCRQFGHFARSCGDVELLAALN